MLIGRATTWTPSNKPQLLKQGVVRLLSVIQMLAKHDVVAAVLLLVRSILYDKQAFINSLFALVISGSKMTVAISQYVIS